jgi:hypothetical protein
MELEIIMLSEISQSHRDRYHIYGTWDRQNMKVKGRLLGMLKGQRGRGGG